MPMRPSTPSPSDQPSQRGVRRPAPGGDADDDALEAEASGRGPGTAGADAGDQPADASDLGDTGGDEGGEGNYDAARRHRASAERFVADGRVDEAAQDAAPDSDQEARDLQEAEARGRRPARG